MERFEKFSKVKVLVVGDVMLDKYLWGEVSRISPEAPVPVVNLKNTSYIAGGAANVAANVAGLGATPFLVGAIGEDGEGSLFPKVLADSNVSADYLVKIPSRQTTVKTRIIAHNQQIVRVDQETTQRLSKGEEETIWRQIEKLLTAADAIVISDYNKGLLTENLTARLIMQGKLENKIILVDPKGSDYDKYMGATIITPNKFEVANVCRLNGFNEETLQNAGRDLLSRLKLDALLITRGEEGMTLFENGKSPVHLEAQARHVYDVTGAGDTVIASLAVSLGAGERFMGAAEIANTAAGLVVSEVGTSAIKITALRDAFKVMR